MVTIQWRKKYKQQYMGPVATRRTQHPHTKAFTYMLWPVCVFVRGKYAKRIISMVGNGFKPH